MKTIKDWKNFINEGVVIGDQKFEISDEKIEEWDYFIEMDRGRLMPYICKLDSDPDAEDHKIGNVDVIVMNKNTFEWNSSMVEYKKITNL